MARPTKFSQEVAQRIIEAVRDGLPYRLAAAYGGVHHDTFREWRRAGEAGEEPFVAFSAAVEQAEAEGALRNLRFINTTPDWRARAWILEHRHPAEFGGKPTVVAVVDPSATPGLNELKDMWNDADA